ncbi:MAG: alpha/beta hydrolase [Phycisphaerales bacterium]
MRELLHLLILLAVGGGLLLVILTVGIVATAIRPRRETAAWAVARGRPVDPADLGWEHAAWNVGRPGDVSLRGWTIDAPGGRPPGTPTVDRMVLAHGWYRSRRALLDRVEPMARHASRLVMADARGHGESGGSSTLGRREPGDLLAIVDATAPEDGSADRVLLVGWSLGATAAVQAAADAMATDPDRSDLVGVVAIAPVTNLRMTLDARIRQFDLPPWLLGPLVRLTLRVLGAWPAPLVPDAIGVPVLVVHGADDEICPARDVQRWVDASAAAGADVQLHLILGAGHDEPERGDPEGVAAALADFAARTRGAGAPAITPEPETAGP